MENKDFNQYLLARYRFDDAIHVGKDSSGNKNDAIPMGSKPPVISKVNGKYGAKLFGGRASSYFTLPSDLLKDVSDNTGVTVATWVNFGLGYNVWERIFDFGRNDRGPFMFLTRNLRGVCHNSTDLAADAGRSYEMDQWMHVCMTVFGTEQGTKSSAGPIVYLNGEVVADGSISQTSSGTYARLRGFFDTFYNPENYSSNYIGHSQFAVDNDFCGYISDFRVYGKALEADQIMDIMCESLSERNLVELAKNKFLKFPSLIITKDITLPTSLMSGKVNVSWESSKKDILSDDGKLLNITAPTAVTLTATISKGYYSTVRTFEMSALPKERPPYTLNVDGNDEVLDISPTLYGLFYEDINNAADGGIYAELVMNRSFESFAYDTYDYRSGKNGTSTGKNSMPMDGWSGDIDCVTVRNFGGLNDFLGIEDRDINSHYITVMDGAVLFNKGYSDRNRRCSIAIYEDESYEFTIWARSIKGGSIMIQVMDKFCRPITDTTTIKIEAGDTWKKYGVDKKIVLNGTDTKLGQLVMIFNGEISIDMVSLMPSNVWGAEEEPTSATAHTNYLKNPNYRLRRDMVEAMRDLHPTFLRFPGGCISEGSYIWDNVYDWKDSVGPVETRKENYNVWGYMMTMGLGYMEYFQLAEDLNATPLPVMACGVLCQARSDYANPAGGALRDKYIKNFTDLIDFAISIDFENNEWARLRRDMGHEDPFDMHYLGVGNENWGIEFFANFQIFKKAIDDYMNANYPGYELHILSTVGAQADDKAYVEGWQFLSGKWKDTDAVVEFTDGKISFSEKITWYEYQPNYMETIADEHYYRSNDYLISNVDRYNYYYRAYDANGVLDDSRTSKVFVGEYASTDKNTLAGAIAEAAIMTGFEQNSDVVRLAATAPLFNKVLTDATYRWTPDCIWFDNEKLWKTPNYYVQQLFAKYLGTKVLGTNFKTYVNGHEHFLRCRGGIELATKNATIAIRTVKVTSNETGEVLLYDDFRTGLSPENNWIMIPESNGFDIDPVKGLILHAQTSGLNGIYMLDYRWTNYTVKVEAERLSGIEGFYVGVGLDESVSDAKNVLEYAINYDGTATGLKVYKDGIEGYTLGDYSCSTCAGNLRTSAFEPIKDNTLYTIKVDFGGADKRTLLCSYTDGTTESLRLHYKLEPYNRDIFNSVTKDDKHVYVKLVNTDNIEKITKVRFNNLSVSGGKRITLTGDPKQANVPNINKKSGEVIVPVEREVVMEENFTTMTLEPNSLTVLVMDLA
ncbi:MAG: alpha-L-arabinofuranosidase [Lachnospiraceae bacterium]|nr:alpha-L-arabinofuranosidase [Lachnospiraceae bacterium]